MIGSSATDLVESEQYIAEDCAEEGVGSFRSGITQLGKEEEGLNIWQGLTNAKYSKCFVISSLLIQSNLFVRS